VPINSAVIDRAAQITPEQPEHPLFGDVLLQELVEQLVVDTRLVALYIRTENKLVRAKLGRHLPHRSLGSAVTLKMVAAPGELRLQHRRQDKRQGFEHQGVQSGPQFERFARNTQDAQGTKAKAPAAQLRLQPRLEALPLSAQGPDVAVGIMPHP